MAKLKKNNLAMNLANLATLIRVVMVFITITCLLHRNPAVRMWGFIILLLAFLLDGLDGILARRFGASNNIGSLIDTLGDRITENVMLVFFSYKNLIPLFIPLVFISRSFIADFIRFLSYHKGIGTFSINNSKFGFYIVASKTSRAIYLILKFFVFLLGAFIIVYSEKKSFYELSLYPFLFYAAIILTIVNIARFTALIFDSRKIIKEAFLKNKNQ